MTALKDKTLISILSKTSKGHYKEEHALQSNSIDVKDTSLPMHISQLIELIKVLYTKINNFKKEITSHIDKKSPILTIPRINNIATSATIGEINDINNFDSPSKLLAFEELNPKENNQEILTLHPVEYLKKNLHLYAML